MAYKLQQQLTGSRYFRNGVWGRVAGIRSV